MARGNDGLLGSREQMFDFWHATRHTPAVATQKRIARFALAKGSEADATVQRVKPLRSLSAAPVPAGAFYFSVHTSYFSSAAGASLVPDIELK